MNKVKKQLSEQDFKYYVRAKILYSLINCYFRFVVTILQFASITLVLKRGRRYCGLKHLTSISHLVLKK